MTYNNDIREAAAKAGVKLWEIADKLGTVDSSLSRKLRKELPADTKKRIKEIISEIASDRRR